MNMRVLLADDHALIRAGLRALLLTMPGVGEVYEAGDGAEALTELAQHDPDVVLMDIAMPGMNGLQAMARIREVCPRTRVIILSMHAGEEYVSRALRAGASGYVVKAGAAEDLQQALGLAMRGQTYVSPSARPGTSARARDGAGPAEQLTDRHLEVLKLISQGLRTRQIATTLGIAVKTVECHRAELMRRVRVRNVAGLVRYAVRSGLVGADQ